MKFNLISTDGGASELRATPENLDAWPAVRSLRCDRTIDPISPDRLAIACILAFGPWCSGQLTFPDQVSSLTAQRLTRWIPERWLHAFPVHPANIPIPRGTKVFTLERAVCQSRTRDTPTIFSMSAAVQPISTVSNEVWELASNAWMLENGPRNALSSWAPHMALAVLFSEALGVDIFSISGLVLEEDEQTQLQSLLSCGGLGLEIL